MSIKSGLIAGFVATVVLSLLMMLKHTLGAMPALNPIADIVQIADHFTGARLPMLAGWIGHFLIGTLAWGIAYAIIAPVLPGDASVKGLIFGGLAWLAMMIVFMPLAGNGFFAMKLGMAVVVATLALHLVYGVVLGVVYGGFAPNRSVRLLEEIET
jgi:hypothetical protein